MTRRQLLRILLVLPEILQMTSIPAAPRRPVVPMQGPDFVMEKVKGWVEHPGADSELTLADGSHWRVDTHRADYAATASYIDYARTSGATLLVSGDKASGELEDVGQANALAAQRVADHDVEGRVVVLFHGPPQVYRVRLSRPGAAHDLALLRHSVASGAFFDTPDLLVGLDIRAKEVVAVQPLKAAAAAPAASGPVPRR